MILDSEQQIQETIFDVPLTPENLINWGCRPVQIGGKYDTWEFEYKETTRTFEGYWFFEPIFGPGKSYIAYITTKHYANKEKTSWYSFCHEKARTWKELLDWFDAEDEFYKDHPEEKVGTPEYERKKKRDLLIGEEMDNLRKLANKTVCKYEKYIGPYPHDGNDKLWFGLYCTATRKIQLEHPELF